MTDLELYWLAGLLEGEGSFVIDHQPSARNRRRPSIVISLQMCDRDVVDRAADLMGSKVHQARRRKVRPNESVSWRTVLRSQAAEDLMCQLLPLMGIRRQRAITACLTLENPSHRRATT